MATEYNVLAPGPVNLHPKVREALALPMIHHRTPEFDQILKRVLHNLKQVFKTQNDCYVLTSTGSGGMECLLVNTLAPGDVVLGIDSGKFGERWCEMVETFGGKLERLKIPWGQAVTADLIHQELKKNPAIKIVMTQACETSTGVIHPIEEIGQLLKSEYPGVIFLVDGITALGAVNLPMDAWNIDGLVGGSQKAFMLPTGLSLVSFSAKAWKKIEANPLPRFYFDIRREKKANDKGETFFSSNVTLIRALDVVLELINSTGFDNHLREIKLRADFIRKYALQIGFSLYSQSPSDSVTALWMPKKSHSQEFRKLLEDEFHITVMGGQDEARDKIIRIGHMGHIMPGQQLKLIESLYQLLVKTGQITEINNFSNIQKQMRMDLGI